MAWYSVRCVFEHDDGNYEERITVWSAQSLDEAIERAEEEAETFASGVKGRYAGLAQAYQLANDLSDGAEVFSLIRVSDLACDDYIDAFFDTGAELQGPSS